MDRCGLCWVRVIVTILGIFVTDRVICSYCLLTGATKLETPCGVLDVDVEAQKKLNESVDSMHNHLSVGHLQSL